MSIKSRLNAIHRFIRSHPDKHLAVVGEGETYDLYRCRCCGEIVRYVKGFYPLPWRGKF